MIVSALTFLDCGSSERTEFDSCVAIHATAAYAHLEALVRGNMTELRIAVGGDVVQLGVGKVRLLAAHHSLVRAAQRGREPRRVVVHYMLELLLLLRRRDAAQPRSALGALLAHGKGLPQTNTDRVGAY